MWEVGGEGEKNKKPFYSIYSISLYNTTISATCPHTTNSTEDLSPPVVQSTACRKAL